MSFKAKYIQRGEALDYVPAANVAAGDVVFLGSLCGIAKLDIKAGELGALAITGVYEFAKASGTAISIGDPLFWDASNSRVTTSDNGYYVGVAVTSAVSADTAVRAVINVGNPSGGADDSSSSSSSSSN